VRIIVRAKEQNKNFIRFGVTLKVQRGTLPAWDQSCTRFGIVVEAVVRIFSRNTLIAFVKTREGAKDHHALKSALEAWFAEALAAKWTKMSDIKAQYASASVVSSDRVVFNIKGNSYRLVVALNFPFGGVFIKWLGSHADYDKIDVTTVEYED
jgi:mRNA interferase HigB